MHVVAAFPVEQVKFVHLNIRFEAPGSGRLETLNSWQASGAALRCDPCPHGAANGVMVQREHTINGLCHSDIPVMAFGSLSLCRLFGFCTVCVSCFPNQQLMNLCSR